MPKLLTHQTEQPHRQRREQNGIDPVEDAAVARDDVAAVFQAGFAFEPRLCQVAKEAEDLGQQGHYNPLPHFQAGLLEEWDVIKPDSQACRKHTAEEESLPRLTWGNLRGQFMFSEQRPEDVGGRVSHPNQDEKA